MPNAIVELNKGNALMKAFIGQQSDFYYLPYSDDIPENNLSKIRQRVGGFYGELNKEITAFSI